MAEEHGFHAPEGHRLCANNCGLFGSPATRNFCSKCYRDLCLKEEKQQPKAHAETRLFGSPVSSSNVLPSHQETVCPSPIAPLHAEVDAEAVPAANPDRCSACRRRVGLTGFRCRCGTSFCGTHRYPEKHGCTFDFKAMGREAIAKANPVVKAEKLIKI